MKQKMYVLATLIVVSTLFVSGCTSSSISGSNIKSDSKIKDIITDPGKYEGSEVTVSGKVINVVDLRPELRSYKINDGSASIEIISDTVPKMGDQVTAKGIVKAGQSVVFIDARGITSDVKATPQITPNSITPKVTPQSTPKAATSTISATTAPTSTLTEGALITGKTGETFDLGSGYNLEIVGVSDPKINNVWVALKKNGVKVDDGVLNLDKPLILGNVISLNLKSINEGKTAYVAQFTYNFI